MPSRVRTRTTRARGNANLCYFLNNLGPMQSLSGLVLPFWVKYDNTKGYEVRRTAFLTSAVTTYGIVLIMFGIGVMFIFLGFFVLRLLAYYSSIFFTFALVGFLVGTIVKCIQIKHMISHPKLIDENVPLPPDEDVVSSSTNIGQSSQDYRNKSPQMGMDQYGRPTQMRTFAPPPQSYAPHSQQYGPPPPNPSFMPQNHHYHDDYPPHMHYGDYNRNSDIYPGGQFPPSSSSGFVPEMLPPGYEPPTYPYSSSQQPQHLPYPDYDPDQ